MTPTELLAAATARLEPLERDSNAAWWDANTTATEANQERRTATAIALSNALADADLFSEVRAARADGLDDPLVDRELRVLEDELAPNQVDPALREQMIALQAELEARFARHRGVVDGRPVDDNAIADILRASNDTDERRAAWEASKSVGRAVADDVRQLVRLRNDAARSLGFRDHFALTLATSEYDERRLFATLDEVDAITRQPFADLKAALDDQIAARFGIDRDAIGPWHYDDPFFQEPPGSVGVDLDPHLAERDVEALTVRTFEGLGLDIEPVLARSDLLPRDAKNQHAFCIDVDRSGDVRVLCNNTPGERWTDTMLHEFGHAVYFRGVARELPWLLRTMHNCVTEGVAMRCARLVREPRWLREIAEVQASTVDALTPALRRARQASLLVFCRWVLVMTHFERGLYANPDGPHDDRWWDLVERYQLVRRPNGRHEPDWAAKIHVAVAPVYYHNYLFGELIASQLAQAFGPLVADRDAGRALGIRLFEPGATLRWDTLVEHATGMPLAPSVLLHDLDA